MFIRPSPILALWLKQLTTSRIVVGFLLLVLFLYASTGSPDASIANKETASEIRNDEESVLSEKYTDMSIIGSIDDLYRKAEGLVEAGKFDSAMMTLRPVLHSQVAEKDETFFLALLLMADLFRRNNAPDSAFNLLEHCLQELNHQMPDTNLVWARYYQRLGTVFNSLEDYNAGIAATKRAIDLWVRISGPADTNLADLYSNLGNSYTFLNDYQNALIQYQAAILVIEKGNVRGMRIKARIFQNTALNYSAMGDFDNAGLMFDRAFRKFEGYLQPNDPLWARHYSSYASMLYWAGSSHDALRYYQKARQVLLQNYGSTHLAVGSNLINQATVYSILYDYDKAYHFNNLAINIFELQLQGDDDRLLSSYQNAGIYLTRLTKFDQALECLHKSINPARLNSTNIMAYRNLGALHHEMGQYDEADYWFEKAYTGSKALYGAEHTQTALTNLRYGRFLTDAGDHEKAHLMLKQAVEVYERILGPLSRDYGHALFQWGKNHMEMGKTDRAIDVLHKAVSVFSPGFESDDAMQNPLFGQLARDPFSLNAIYLKAKSLHRRYAETGSETDLQAASQTYHIAIALISEMRNTIGSEENRMNISRLTSSVISAAMECAWDLYARKPETTQLQQALEISEAGKAMVLLGMLHELEIRRYSLMPDDIQVLESSTIHQMNALESLIRNEQASHPPDPLKLNRWQTELIALKSRKDSLTDAIYNQYPEYQRLKFDFPVPDLGKLQSSLHADEAVISYTLTGDYLFAFVVSSDTALIHRETIDDRFYQQLESLRRLLSGDLLGSFALKDYHGYLETAYSLYSILVEPVSSIVREKRLTIVPDKQLAFVPFEALITSLPDGGEIDFSGLPYLLYANAVKYAYSLSLEQHFPKRKKKPAKAGMLALAPSYGGHTHFNASENVHNRLMQLPWAAEEVGHLKKVYKAVGFTGAKATKPLFIQKASDYQLLHLAMHATLDDKAPLFSALHFSPATDSLQSEVLEVHELYNMQLNADFAFLSACNTADGPMLLGEGVMSFARGFFYAGIESLVMTLWAVDDLASSHLVESFYAYIANGLHKDEALRNAKLDYLATSDNLKAHPFYWAGYLQLGSNSPVNLLSGKPFRNKEPLIGLFLQLVVVIWMMWPMARVMPWKGKKIKQD